MKMFALLAAAGAVAAATLPVAATAQTHTRVVHRTVTTRVVHHRGTPHWRTVCSTHWNHHHRVRTCNRVRTWS